MSQTAGVVRQAFFEAIFVVFGVAVAYAVNEWRQDRADQQQSNRALLGIIEELKANRAKTEDSHHYHQELYQQLLELAGKGEVPDISLFHKGFIHPSSLFESAWETAKNTGASRFFSYENTLSINQMYELQLRYQKQGEIVGNLLYDDLYHGGRNAVLGRHLLEVISTFVWKERELLREYDQALSNLVL